jgi:flagellar basal body rod protein FlgB
MLNTENRIIEFLRKSLSSFQS